MTNSLSPRTFVSRDESACTRMLGVIHLTPYTLLQASTSTRELSMAPGGGHVGKTLWWCLRAAPWGWHSHGLRSRSSTGNAKP